MLTNKERVCVVCTPFGTEELPELNECDYGTAWCNKNISDCIYRLASEKRRTEIEYKQLQENYLWMENQRGSLLVENGKLKEENEKLKTIYRRLQENYEFISEQWEKQLNIISEMKEKLESHKITIPVEVKIRFVDGC